MTPLEEKAIVAAVLGGNKGAFAALIERYKKPIFNLMVRTCGSLEDAADLTQETFIKAFERLETFDADRKFFSWLYTIGINHARDHARRKKTQPMFVEHCEDIDTFSPAITDCPDAARQMDALTIEKALGVLPLEQREAVVLRYREDLSMQDIADILGISVSAAKMRVHRALGALKIFLVSGSGQ